MSRRAETIKAAAKLAGQKMRDIDGRHSYAAEAGALSAHVEILCEELDTYIGANHKAAKGVGVARLPLGDAEVLVEYDYEPGEDPVMDLNSPMCGPGCAANASILGVLINGTWCDPEDFMDPDTIERWREAICDSEEVAARASVEDYHASRHMEEA
jgi:hypothetical protein